MLNAVFRKTMENIRKYRIVKLLTSWEGRYGANHYISNPAFHSSTIFDDNLVSVEMRKTEILFDKPLYVGMCILDISKTCDDCKLLYTDTDSLIYDIKCDDFYEIINENLHKFDTSDFKQDNPYCIPRVNKKVVGLMKDENNGVIMMEFVGLRAKMYSIKCGSVCTTKKIKGVKKDVIKNHIKFEDYLTCLREFQEIYRSQRLIRSYLHEIYSVEQTKFALSPFDDKGVLLENPTDTLPHGHYSTV
ncbi:hypothetical protein NQ315_012310 [Exocentrus adspersus]|uniref:DNA-directed DNA polymerase n=1 Tax=Exocentrus adspersus TaxID=1586481 RepID=A0AAV8VC68_9CUCU|nr:hypothetical protein NQ315_012310 [Exocentrus adspersus]